LPCPSLQKKKTKDKQRGWVPWEKVFEEAKGFRGARAAPSYAEALWVSLRQAMIPAGAFPNRAAIPVPSPSFPLKGKYQKWRQKERGD
jgi:hypothetical protein